MTKRERFEGCIIGGAIGDAWGSSYENQVEQREDTFYFGEQPPKRILSWSITDDTQLTLATIEAMIKTEGFSLDIIIHQFLDLYRRRILKGIGASTLKALSELNAGGHWSQVGRRGEYAAGNGAAMRIAPLAFREGITDEQIRNLCMLTHHNDEAYVGAKCVLIAIRAILDEDWMGEGSLLSYLIQRIPDTRIRDRLIEIEDITNLSVIGEKGNNGYVVNSVPLAIAAASQVRQIGMEAMFKQLIAIGGDTDTNCSIAGQIAGTLIGRSQIPNHLVAQLKELKEYDWIASTIDAFVAKEKFEK